MQGLVVLLFLLFLCFPSLAGDLRESYSYCLRKGVDPMIVEAIALIEGYGENPYAYPYLLRVNIKGRVRVRGRGVREVGRNLFLCDNKLICKRIAEMLVRKGIKNFDVGVFQLNYYYQSRRVRNFLDVALTPSEAFKVVCDIISENFRVAGRTANAVALYHSSRRDRNQRYAIKFWKVYRKLKSKACRRNQ